MLFIEIECSLFIYSYNTSVNKYVLHVVLELSLI